ncbi:hypothetical protein FACS1894156_8150 [Bacteroidia bacterium]|nr:hypothetical protein FACS1894156_8150 [Bacteroidia bacterium]
MKKIEYLLLKITIILGITFTVGYCTYPYVISIEQANKWNIQNFEQNRNFFQNVVDVSIDIYSKNYKYQQEKVLHMNDLPIEMQKQLNKKGICTLIATITNKNEKMNIYIDFITEKSWWNRVLNNVNIQYNSYKKFEHCQKNNLNFHIGEICLGNGWFFYIDTDWL